MPDFPTDPNCIFCKIVARQIPAHQVYEDAQTLAFLDIGPLAHGHTLVIPKAHHAVLDQLPDPLAGTCMQVVVKLSRAVMTATGATAWNVLQNNGQTAQQSVDHVHFHIIPRATGDTIGYRWNAGRLKEKDADQLKKAIKASL